MRDDPFQKELRPGSTIEFGRPVGQRPRTRATKEVATTKRPIDDQRHLSILRERKNALFRLAFHDRVIDLEKIEFFGPQNFFNFTKGAGFIMRDSDVANAPLLLPFAQSRQMRVHIDKVMDLHQIDAFCSEPRH